MSPIATAYHYTVNPIKKSTIIGSLVPIIRRQAIATPKFHKFIRILTMFYQVEHTIFVMTLLYVLLTVYILAINFYSFRFIKTQSEESESGTEYRQDGKLILAALLGGALSIYITMFIMRYRLNNLLLMIALPVLAVLNIYCFIIGYRSVYWLIM